MPPAAGSSTATSSAASPGIRAGRLNGTPALASNPPRLRPRSLRTRVRQQGPRQSAHPSCGARRCRPVARPRPPDPIFGPFKVCDLHLPGGVDLRRVMPHKRRSTRRSRWPPPARPAAADWSSTASSMRMAGKWSRTVIASSAATGPPSGRFRHEPLQGARSLRWWMVYVIAVAAPRTPSPGFVKRGKDVPFTGTGASREVSRNRRDWCSPETLPPASCVLLAGRPTPASRHHLCVPDPGVRRRPH